MTKTSASGNAPRRVAATQRVCCVRFRGRIWLENSNFSGWVLVFYLCGKQVKSGQTQCASNFAATALADVLNTVGSMQRCAGLARRGSDAPGDLCHRFHLPRALARPRLVLGPRRAAKPLRATGQPRWGNLGCALLLHTKILPSRDSSRWPWTSGPGRGAARGRAPSTLSPRRRLRVSGAAMASRRAPLARDMMDLVLIYTHTTQARGARAAAGPGP